MNNLVGHEHLVDGSLLWNVTVFNCVSGLLVISVATVVFLVLPLMMVVIVWTALTLLLWMSIVPSLLTVVVNIWRTWLFEGLVGSIGLLYFL